MAFPWNKKEKQTELTPEGDGDGQNVDPLEKKIPESVSETPLMDTDGVQSPFGADGSLAGRSEKEVVDELALMQATIQAQKDALDAGENQPSPVIAPEPEPEPAELTAEDFFRDPAGMIDGIVSRRVQSEMKTIIAPFERDLAQSQAQSAWDTVGSSRPNMNLMRPLMEVIIKERNIPDPSVGVLEDVYDLALARAVRTGENITSNNSPLVKDPKTTLKQERTVSPQHTPSSHPIADTTKTPDIEPLTENEARIARERGLTHLEYRQWQNMDEADILLPAESAS
jgi:hypothetical protein